MVVPMSKPAGLDSVLQQQKSALANEVAEGSRSLLERSSTSPSAGKVSGSSSKGPVEAKCLSKECLPEVAEQDYVSHYNDPHGNDRPMASMGLFPPHNLTVKIYVYQSDEVGAIKELTSGQKMTLTICTIGMWGTQTVLHKFLEKSSVRTLDPAQADFFFVPAYAKCASDREKKNDQQMNQAYIKLVQSLPYFRRSGGRDHIFVFPSGRGATVFRDWKQHIGQSIFLSPEGHFTDNYAAQAPYFHTHKDIAIPGRLDNRKDGLVAAAKPQKTRTTLGIFYGTHQGKETRRTLLELGKRYPSLVKASCERTPKYFEYMGDSQFCFAPRGQSSWTLRFYESFFAGCIPVILADSIELPFQDVIDYSKVTIKWPMTKVDETLLEYLKSVPLEDRERMAAAGKAIRCMFVYNSDVSSCNALSAIMWQLEKRKRVFQQSHEVFWLHSGEMVDRSLDNMGAWRGPFNTNNVFNAEPTQKCNPTCHEGGPNLCLATENGIVCKGLKAGAAKC
eukprot:CAMPEP_0196575454 /NCGR_PEP_ID=MMETSP1081-20130531/4928_1 /TAXON_ID=36882 /ORGANISM="Pyramimonas amylifera, Strain CCMP720" /LENGTH=504 /DNA_ID=CAMNT_0041893761 /DNA_START=149 /DNA_END=1663 /DNA_ORIENTATION=-